MDHNFKKSGVKYGRKLKNMEWNLGEHWKKWGEIWKGIEKSWVKIGKSKKVGETHAI